jgi:hypothetical protein
MIDEFDNDCGYDFKNIQFKRYKVTSTVIDVTVIQDYYIGFKPYDDYNLNSMKNLEVNESEFRYIYTFNDSSYNDLSMNNSTNRCFSNHISRYKNEFKNNICTLNNVVIYNSLGDITLYKFDDDCKAMSVFSADASTFMNHFGQFSKGNVLFSAHFSQNKFLDNFTSCTIISELSMQENYISEYAQHNTILVKRFSNNDIGTRFTYNTINNFNEEVGFNRIKDYVQNNNITCRFMSNDIGHNFMNNEITSRFATNKVGDNFKNNYCAGIINSDFKVMCQYNTFGSITACTIGSGFRYNTFKKASDANSTTIKNCTFGDYV